jgi:hypothetical protein
MTFDCIQAHDRVSLSSDVTRCLTFRCLVIDVLLLRGVDCRMFVAISAF